MRIVCGLVLATVLICACACGAAPGASSPATVPTAATPASSEPPRTADGGDDPKEAHTDHQPRHAGVVLMNGDLHFEVVLDGAGQYRVYFSDAFRKDVPAAVASQVTVTVMRKGQPPEVLPLRPDSSGSHWMASGMAVTDPEAMVRIAYSVAGKPYFIDLPLAAAGRGGAASAS